MDEAEARDILAAHLSPLRELPYDQLVRRLLDRVETAEAYGPSGAWYQLEVQGFCDAKPNEVLRVMGAIDGGRGMAREHSAD